MPLDVKNMSDEQLQAILKGTPKPTAAATAPQAAPQAPQGGGWGEDLKDFGAGAWHGLTAPVRGVRQLMNMNDPVMLQKLLDEEKAAEEKLGSWGQVGNVGAQIGSTFIPFAGQAGKLAQGANWAAKGAKALSPAMKTAAKAGALAATQPVVGGSAEDFLGEKGTQAGTGAVLGGVAGKLGDMLSKPWLGKEAREASRVLGGQATPGQLLAAAGQGKEGMVAGAKRYIGDLEEQAGRWLAGTGIEATREAARAQGARTMVKDIADRAGFGTKTTANTAGGVNALPPPGGARAGLQTRSTLDDSGDFEKLLNSAQAAKGKAYDSIVSQLNVGDAATFQHGVRNLVRQDPVFSNLNKQEQKFVQNILKKATPGQGKDISGKGLQDVLSDLSKELRNHTGPAATASERRVGDALSKMRDHIMEVAQKNTAPETWGQYQALNKAHGQLGKIEGASRYKQAWERGHPSMSDITQRSLAGGRPSAGAKELAREARDIGEYAGKGRAPSDLRDIQRLVSLGSHIPSMALRGIYNEPTIKLINKLAAEGHPGALKQLEQLGLIAGASQ